MNRVNFRSARAMMSALLPCLLLLSLSRYYYCCHCCFSCSHSLIFVGRYIEHGDLWAEDASRRAQDGERLPAAPAWRQLQREDQGIDREIRPRHGTTQDENRGTLVYTVYTLYNRRVWFYWQHNLLGNPILSNLTSITGHSLESPRTVTCTFGDE